MKVKGIITVIFFLVISILLSSIVLAVPPSEIFTPTTSDSIAIEFPNFEWHKINTLRKFHFHLYNSTSGYPLTTQIPISCYFHLYNSSGSHSYEANNVQSFKAPIDFEIQVSANNFTTIGEHRYLFQCNTSKIGGFVVSSFMVTQTGRQTIPTRNFNLPLIVLLLGILTAIIFFASTTEHTSIRLGLLLMGFLMVLIMFQFQLSFINGSTLTDIANMLLAQLKIYTVGFWLFLFFVTTFIFYRVLKTFGGMGERGKREQKEDEFRW